MEKGRLEKIIERITGGQEIRGMTEFRALDAAGDTSSPLMVEGYAATFDEPYVLWDSPEYKVVEQIDRGVLNDADLSDVIFQFDHAGRVFARTRNRTLEVDADDHGIKISADISGAADGAGLWHDIKNGLIDRMSWRFRVSEDKREVTEDHESGKITVLRTIMKVGKVYDVSAVSMPANDGTDISARSYCDGVIAELEAERLRAEREKRAREILALKIKILEKGY